MRLEVTMRSRVWNVTELYRKSSSHLPHDPIFYRLDMEGPTRYHIRYMTLEYLRPAILSELRVVADRVAPLLSLD